MTITTGSLIRETSTTTGTGSYTLLGAVSNYRAFSAAVTPSATALVEYVARMGAVYESGVGLLSAAGTLQRVGLIESSTGSAIDWAAGTKDIYIDHVSVYTGKLNLAAGSTAPTVANNYTQGYGHGSLWITGTTLQDRVVWICTDPGIPGATSATWRLLGGPGFSALFKTTSGFVASGICLGARESNFADDTLAPENVVAMGIGARAAWADSVVIGHVWENNDGGAQVVVVGGSVTTADATPVPINFSQADGSGTQTYLPILQDSALLFEWTISARDNVAGEVAFYTLVVGVERTGSGDPTILFQTLVALHEDDASWTAAASIDTTNDGIQIDITGDATNPVRWCASARVTQLAFT